MSSNAFRQREYHPRRHHEPPPPPPTTAGPSANDQLAIAIVAHLAALKPRTSDEQQSAALRMLRCRDLGGVRLADAMAMVDDYAAVEMFFDLATFRAAFERRFSAPDRAVASTAKMFDDWRRDRERVEREREQVDAALAGIARAELIRRRDAIADDVARRPIDPASKLSAAEQRAANGVEAALIRRSDPTRPGLARSMIYERQLAAPT